RRTGGDRSLEGTDIRPHLPEVQAEVLIPAADDDPRAEGAAKHTERLTQCRTRVLLVELWPEERQQAVAAVEAGRRRRGEVGEESKAPGLAEEHPHLASVGTGEAESSEHTELDHARPRWRTRRRPEVQPPLGRRDGRRHARVTGTLRRSPKLAPRFKRSPAARLQQSRFQGV